MGRSLADWELTARERIRDTLAEYTWSGDSLRLDGLAAAFCPDGALEVAGLEPIRGRAAIAAFLGGAPTADDETRRAMAKAARGGAGKRIVRHNITNVRFRELTRDRAHVEAYFTVFTEIGLDHMGRYRDEFEPVDDAWLIRHRYVSVDWRAEGSSMAPKRPA